MHKPINLINKLFLLTMIQLGVVSDQVTWCRLYESKFAVSHKQKPVYYNGKQKQRSKS